MQNLKKASERIIQVIISLTPILLAGSLINLSYSNTVYSSREEQLISYNIQ